MTNPTSKTSAVAEAIANEIAQIDDIAIVTGLRNGYALEEDYSIGNVSVPEIAAIVDAHLVKERGQRERDIADCATIISGLEKERDLARGFKVCFPYESIGNVTPALFKDGSYYYLKDEAKEETIREALLAVRERIVILDDGLYGPSSSTRETLNLIDASLAL